MTPAEYQEQAHEFARYPEEHADLYLSLKWAEERGELLGLYAKAVGKGDGLSPDPIQVESEIGDMLWVKFEWLTVQGHSTEGQDWTSFGGGPRGVQEALRWLMGGYCIWECLAYLAPHGLEVAACSNLAKLKGREQRDELLSRDGYLSRPIAATIEEK